MNMQQPMQGGIPQGQPQGQMASQQQAPTCPTCGQHPQAQAILGQLIQELQMRQQGGGQGLQGQMPAAPPTDVSGGRG